MTPTLQYSRTTTQEDITETDCMSNPNAKQAVHTLATMYKLSPTVRVDCQDYFSLS